MKKPQDSESQFINIAELRLGMYVYLDLGWMKHPFALNSFKITGQDQIDTLRGLGINRIRWSSAKSDPPAPAPGAQEKQDTELRAAQEARQALDSALAVEADLRRQRRERLDVQRESLEACEREFATASRACRQLMDNLVTHPEAAREQTEQVIGSMVGKILDQEESAIRLLSEAAGEKSTLHSLNVTIISLLLGHAMGLDSTTLKDLGTGALLHDIGKIKLPERLRWADDQLSPAERKLYQEHVAHSIALGKCMQLGDNALAILAQHHERTDGRGYPAQLTGEAISPLARIVSLVNLYDNLCNPGNPALAVTPHEALSQIFAQMKRQFDGPVLTLFIRMMGVYPPGSVVELTDGRFALVVSINSMRPLKPQIVIFDPRVPRDEALVEDLEKTDDLGIRRSLKPLHLPKAAFDYLSPRQRMCYFFEQARNTGERELLP